MGVNTKEMASYLVNMFKDKLEPHVHDAFEVSKDVATSCVYEILKSKPENPDFWKEVRKQVYNTTKDGLEPKRTFFERVKEFFR